MVVDFSTCLIGLLNLERDCSPANRMYKVRYHFFNCKLCGKPFHLVLVLSHCCMYYVVFELHFCFSPQSVLNKGIEVLETRP